MHITLGKIILSHGTVTTLVEWIGINAMVVIVAVTTIQTNLGIIIFHPADVVIL